MTDLADKLASQAFFNVHIMPLVSAFRDCISLG